MNEESLTQKTVNPAYNYNADHTGRKYSKEFTSLFWALHNGGIHAKNAIKTIGGIAELDVKDAHKIYKILVYAGLSIPVIITMMTTAPVTALLGVLGGSIVGLVGRIGETEANKVLEERRRTQAAIELASQYKGRIALLEGRETKLKALTKARFESTVFILEQRYKGQLLQKEDKITRLREENIKVIDEKKTEVKNIITKANKNISEGIILRDQAKINEKDTREKLQYADNLCRNQAQKLTILKDQVQDYDFLCQELETKENMTELNRLKKELEGKKKMLEEKKKMIDGLKKRNGEIEQEKFDLKDDLLKAKNETIKAKDQEIKTLKFAIKYALIVEKPDTGTKQGKENSKRYTAICEGVENGYINDLSFSGLKNFKYAGKGASQRIIKNYREALIQDGLAKMEKGELMPVH